MTNEAVRHAEQCGLPIVYSVDGLLDRFDSGPSARDSSPLHGACSSFSRHGVSPTSAHLRRCSTPWTISQSSSCEKPLAPTRRKKGTRQFLLQPKRWLRRTLGPLKKRKKRKTRRAGDPSQPEGLRKSGIETTERDVYAPAVCGYEETLQRHAAKDPVDAAIQVYLELLADEQGGSVNDTSSDGSISVESLQCLRSTDSLDSSTSLDTSVVWSMKMQCSTQYYRSSVACVLSQAASQVCCGDADCPICRDKYVQLLQTRNIIEGRVRVLRAITGHLQVAYTKEQCSRIRLSPQGLASDSLEKVSSFNAHSSSTWGTTPEGASSCQFANSLSTARLSSQNGCSNPLKRAQARETLRYWTTKVNLCRVFEDVFYNTVGYLRAAEVFYPSTFLVTSAAPLSERVAARQLFLRSEQVLTAQHNHHHRMRCMMQEAWSDHRHLRAEIQQYERLNRRPVAMVLKDAGCCDPSNFASATLLCGLPQSPLGHMSLDHILAQLGRETEDERGAASTESSPKFLQSVSSEGCCADDGDGTDLATAGCRETVSSAKDVQSRTTRFGCSPPLMEQPKHPPQSRNDLVQCPVDSSGTIQPMTGQRHVTFALYAQDTAPTANPTSTPTKVLSSFPPVTTSPLLQLLQQLDVHCIQDDPNPLQVALDLLDAVGEENTVRLAENDLFADGGGEPSHTVAAPTSSRRFPQLIRRQKKVHAKACMQCSQVDYYEPPSSSMKKHRAHVPSCSGRSGKCTVM